MSAIEGTFRSTCERVMGVLRQHKDSLMAMLEAFIHDPLIKWRLLQTQHGATTSSHRPSSVPSVRPSLPHSLRASLDESFGYSTSKHLQAVLRLSLGCPPLAPLFLVACLVGFARRAAHAHRFGTPTPVGDAVIAAARDPGHRGLARATGTPKSSSHCCAPGPAHSPLVQQALNERAVRVIRRVVNKLTGREFGEELSVAQQVQCLIEQATSHQHLCTAYIGWCTDRMPARN